MWFETFRLRRGSILLLAVGAAVGCDDGRMSAAPTPDVASVKAEVPDDGSRFQIVRQGKIGFIDSSGTVRIAPAFASAGDFSEERAAVQTQHKGRWGYIDRYGRVVIEPQFDGAGNFSQGLATVQIGQRYGYIDKAGATVIPPTYKSAESFDRDGCAWVTTQGPQDSDDNHYIDRNGVRIEAEVGGRCGPASRLGFQWDNVIGPVSVQYESTPVRVKRKGLSNLEWKAWRLPRQQPSQLMWKVARPALGLFTLRLWNDGSRSSLCCFPKGFRGDGGRSSPKHARRSRSDARRSTCTRRAASSSRKRRYQRPARPTCV